MAKGLEYYMSLPYRIEIIKDSDEEGYAVFIPELRGCITVGKTISDAIANVEEAKKAWLSSALENGDPIPEPDSIRKYSGEFKLRMPKSLHRKLVEHARDEGISMNQYCIMLLSQNDAALHPSAL